MLSKISLINQEISVKVDIMINIILSTELKIMFALIRFNSIIYD